MSRTKQELKYREARCVPCTPLRLKTCVATWEEAGTPGRGLETVLCLLHKSIQRARKRLRNWSRRPLARTTQSSSRVKVVWGRVPPGTDTHTQLNSCKMILPLVHLPGCLHPSLLRPPHPTPQVSKGFDGRVRDLPPWLLSMSLFFFCFPLHSSSNNRKYYYLVVCCCTWDSPWSTEQ